SRRHLEPPPRRRPGTVRGLPRTRGDGPDVPVGQAARTIRDRLRRRARQARRRPLRPAGFRSAHSLLRRDIAGTGAASHWFKLGRLLTVAAGRPALVSWSGSMFEYLMPSLLMPAYRSTLLDDTCGAAVTRQIRYGAQQQVPWGVSESAYNATDANLTYQYRAFGVPGLGLKRGLGEDLVIAPYATLMALMVE